MKSISRKWIEQQGACGPDYQRALEMLAGKDAEALVPALVDRARAAGVNLLWVGCRLLSSKQLSEFVAFTVAKRRSMLEILLGSAPPASSKALRAESRDEWGIWTSTGDVPARSRATVLRETARDMDNRSPTPAQAEEAALAALRAVSYAGEDQASARSELEDWLAQKLVVDRDG